MAQELKTKRNQYLEHKAQGHKLVTLWLDPKIHQQVKLAADSAQESVTGWCRRAVIGAMTRWKKPLADRTLWPKCNLCGSHHDRNEHFAEE
jgi:hypothetical protein